MASPEWLESWLRTPFYEKKCSKHVHKYFTMYCGACMGEPYCDICWTDEYIEEHKGHHPILQVCASSHRAAIEVHKIRKLFDICYIQQYRTNDKEIVYLNPNLNGVGQPTISIKCKICARRLKDYTYTFCSIACKIKSMELDMQAKKRIDMTRETQEEKCRDIKGEMQVDEKNDPKSLRKKTRKAVPQRAPFQ